MYSLTDAETLDALTAPTGFLNDALAGMRPGATVAIVWPASRARARARACVCVCVCVSMLPSLPFG